MENKISVVINTYNAEEYLEEVLQSVKDFDEVVVCDMESTDRTLDIARQYGCKIVLFPKERGNICEVARNFAIHNASNDWVFVVDADEIVPDELRRYLYEKVSVPEFDEALCVGRINYFMGEHIEHHPDYQLRFFRQSKAQWPAVIHSRPVIDDGRGPVGNIPAKKGLMLIHRCDPSFSERVRKMNNYSDYEVPRRIGKKFPVMKMIFRPLIFFLKVYLFGGAFKYRKRGVINAYMVAIYQMMLISKVVEKQLEEDKETS